MGFVLTCFTFFQFDTLFLFFIFFKPACVNFSSCQFHEGVLWFGSVTCDCSGLGTGFLSCCPPQKKGSISCVPPAHLQCSPATLMTTQMESFIWEVHGSTLWTCSKCWSSSIFYGLWPSSDERWHCRGDCLGVRCGMGVHAGKCFREKGNRAATACLGNSLLMCAFPPCPLPSFPLPEGYWGFRAWEDSGYAGHEAALQTMVSLELPGLFWLWYPQHECTCVVSMSGRNGDYWGGFLFIFFLFLFFHTVSTLASFLQASNFWSIW